MGFPVTALFGALFGVVMLILWVNVTRVRAAAGISIGDGGDVALHEKIRRHGNFMEWVPMTLILLALAEGQGVGAGWLYAAGGLALSGRLLHPFGLTAARAAHPARIIGNTGNILALLLLIGVLGKAALA